MQLSKLTFPVQPLRFWRSDASGVRVLAKGRSDGRSVSVLAKFDDFSACEGKGMCPMALIRPARAFAPNLLEAEYDYIVPLRNKGLWLEGMDLGFSIDRREEPIEASVSPKTARPWYL